MRSISVNVFLLSWSIYAFLVHSFYDCNLRAYMMAVDREMPIDTVQDMIKQGRGLYFIKQYPEFDKYAALPHDEYADEKFLARQAKENGFEYALGSDGLESKDMQVRMVEDGAVIMTADHHALRVASNLARKRFGYDPFRISKFPARVYTSTMSGIPVKKYGGLKEVLEPSMWRLRQGGIIEYYLQSVYTWIPESIEVPPKPIDIRHVVLSLSMSLVGLFMAFLAFMWEVTTTNDIKKHASRVANGTKTIGSHLIGYMVNQPTE